MVQIIRYCHVSLQRYKHVYFGEQVKENSQAYVKRFSTLFSNNYSFSRTF